MAERRTRKVPWPIRDSWNEAVKLDSKLIGRKTDTIPSASMWRAMTKSEKSLYPVLAYCSAKQIFSPGEVFLAGVSGLSTRKSVRSALESLKDKNIINIDYGYKKNILFNQPEKNNFFIGSWLITSGQWAMVGRVCPSAHALLIVMRFLSNKAPDIESEYINEFEKIGIQESNSYSKIDYCYCNESNKVLADLAGITMKTLPVALGWLLNDKLITKWNGPSGGYILPERVDYFYDINKLRSIKIE